MAFKEAKLVQIVDAMDSQFKNIVAFRHECWWNKKVYTILAKNNIEFCGLNHPLLPQDIVQNNKVLYYRFHGIPD